MMPQKVKSLITFGLTLVGAICGVLSTVGNYWEVHLNRHVGIWAICITYMDETSCASRRDYDTSGALKAVQAFMVLGCVGYLAAFIYFSYLHLKTEKAVNRILGLVLTITGPCTLVGLIVYSKMLHDSSMSYGWSYILGYVSVVLSLAAGIICICCSFGTSAPLAA